MQAVLVCILVSTVFAQQWEWPRYRKIQRTCLPWKEPIKRVGSCGTDIGVVCNVTYLMEQCDATPLCNAFNTNGYLKACAGGKSGALCDCDSSVESCMRGLDIYSTYPQVSHGCDHVDLYVLNGAEPPAEWIPGIQSSSILYGSPEPNVCFMPEVANGFAASVVGADAIYIAGLFNGACGSVRKARIPSTLLVSIQNGEVLGGALDMLHATYRQRWAVDGSVVEQQFFAHRTRRHIMVTQFSLVSGPAVTLKLRDPFDPLHQTTSGPGNNCAGSFTIDFNFNNATSGSAFQVYNGVSNLKGDEGEVFLVSIAKTMVPTSVTLGSTSVSFFTSLATSVEFPGNNATAQQVQSLASSEYASAAGDANLYASHTAAWARLYASGMDILPKSADPATIERAQDVAGHINSSFYFLLSSIREDWYPGVSPGGAATQNYQGAVFMDMDWWMGPSLYLLNPVFASSLFEYRYLSLSESARLAKMFGYNGSMFAWTAAYQGRPFGCCDAQGGYEDCLEQHVTGDIGFAVWQYYQAHLNATWLATRGWPLAAAIAEFFISRVVPRPVAGYQGSYSIAGVLPIDEWCVGSGCGCETPGVEDDAQMNGVAKASLLTAARIADIVGQASAASALWRAVGSQLVLLFNTTGGGHHDQFTSASCPDAWGGTHYRPDHTVCPEDVMLLSYPLGDLLNISTSTTRADADLFVPITCQENAGMTTPMHTIVWLSLAEYTLAQAEFNRSMHAACYGPFNVRNEVDKHVDIIGGHFDNTHFLTGDGGYLQAVLFGYGGLRIVEEGIKLLRPSLPESVGYLRLRQLSWRGQQLTVEVTENTMQLFLPACYHVSDAPGTVWTSKGMFEIVLQTFAFPGLLYTC